LRKNNLFWLKIYSNFKSSNFKKIKVQMEVMNNNIPALDAKGKSRLEEYQEIYADDDADVEIEENE